MPGCGHRTGVIHCRDRSGQGVTLALRHSKTLTVPQGCCTVNGTRLAEILAFLVLAVTALVDLECEPDAERFSAGGIGEPRRWARTQRQQAVPVRNPQVVRVVWEKTGADGQTKEPGRGRGDDGNTFTEKVFRLNGYR